MPEGDTILRTAENVGRWLEGRVVTRAESRVPGADLRPVLGSRFERVEARGKHLLMHFSSGHVLHTHMRMTGSWHVYKKGDRWRAPNWQARVILECGDRSAVCFRAPVVEVLDAGEVSAHVALAGLGPDILAGDFDVDDVIARVRQQPGTATIGEVLLDQRVLAGIGNIYRCESLFAARLHPRRTVGALTDDEIRAVVVAASRLMRTNVRAGTTMDRQFGGGPGRPWVYKRAGQPCRRCGESILHDRTGPQARSVYWCPVCQPAQAA